MRGIEQAIARVCAATASELVGGCAQADEGQSTISTQLLDQTLLLKCFLLNHASNDHNTSRRLEVSNVVDVLCDALAAVDDAVDQDDGLLILDVIELDIRRL